jgi:tetratricopeptide (TPR) repeat protein
MDSINKEQPETKPAGRKLLLIGGVIIIFCVPLLLLLFKHKAPVPVKPAVVATVNIAELEALANARPDYNNLVNLSLGYINSNAPGRAIPYLKRAIRLDSTKVLAYNNLGVANIMLKNFNEGIAACQKAINRDPNFQLAKNNLKWGTDEKIKALLTIKKLQATALDKQDLDYVLQLELNYQYIGDYENCLETIKKGLYRYPNNTALINNAGTAMVLNKRYESAIEKFNEVLKLDPANQLAKNNLAWAMQEKAGTN